MQTKGAREMRQSNQSQLQQWFRQPSSETWIKCNTLLLWSPCFPHCSAQGDAKLGSAGGDSEATASALRDLQSMSANICSMNDSVNQLSSRLGGVAVRPGARGGAGAAAGGAGGLSGVDFMRELMKLGGPPAGAGGKVTGGLQAMEDDRQQVKDIDC